MRECKKKSSLNAGRKNRVDDVTRKTNIIKTCDLYAPNRDRDFYDDYVDDVLLPAVRKKFEKHLETCLHCSRKVIEAIERDEAVAASFDLSEIGLRNSRKKKMQWMKEILSQNATPEEYTALAASSARRSDVYGVAYGVAVNKERGILLKCTAAVNRKLLNQSPLEIRARELKSYEKDGLEYKVSVPTTVLENLIKDMFVTHPLLQPLKLYEKTVRVHIDFTDDNTHGRGASSNALKSNNCFIYEADSLELAVLIAILSAVEGKIVDSDIVFSAGVSLHGYLEAVGDIKRKIEIAKEKGMKTFILADENKPECMDKTIKKPGVALHHFEKLEDALNYIGLLGQNLTRKTSTVKKAKTRRANKNRQYLLKGRGEKG